MRAKLVNESLNESETFTDADIKTVKDALPGERPMGRYHVDYFVSKNSQGNALVGVQIDGKRGMPRDAELEALRVPKPKLPLGFSYATGKPVTFGGDPVTPETIREKDDVYSDRGYTDSEFSGYVCYEVIKIKE